MEAETAFRNSLETKCADARRALEHFCEAAKEQRGSEARKHEDQVQFSQQEIRNLQRSLPDVQAGFASTNEELARLMSELAATRREVIRLEGTQGQLAPATERLTASCVGGRRTSERRAAKGQP